MCFRFVFYYNLIINRKGRRVNLQILSYRICSVKKILPQYEMCIRDRHNVVDLNDNRVFAFQPMEGTNLYGFRHNFAAGTLNSDLDTISFDLSVGAGDEGDYVIKMWMY